MSELAHEEPSLRRLNQLFGTDPALAGRLLELANSHTFQVPRQIAGIPEALALLGIAQVRTLVTSAPLGTASRSVPGVHMQQFWRYSLNTAKLARSLAGIVHQNQTAAYTTGLLHALGELVIHLADPDKAQSVNTLVAPFDNNAYEPLAGVIHLASWRARAREAELGEKELAVSFPGEVGLALGLDIDMVLQQDPIDWTAKPEAADYVV